MIADTPCAHAGAQRFCSLSGGTVLPGLFSRCLTLISIARMFAARARRRAFHRHAVLLAALGCLATAPVRAAWTSQDIGTVAAAGHSSTDGTTFTVAGSGADVWGPADAFQFFAQPFAGDGSITARITGMTDTNGWAKAGIMIRESMDSNAANVFLAATPEWHGIVTQQRTAAGADTASTPGPATNAPYWLRLTRTGTTIVAATSADGIGWSTYATLGTSISTTSAYIGLAVTSHNDGVLCPATFDNVSVVTSASQSGPPSAPANLTATALSSSQISLSWTPTSTNQTGFAIERSTGGSFAQVGTVPGNQTSYTDSGLSPSITYFYQVRAVNSSGYGPASNIASATTNPPSSGGAWQSVDIGTSTAGQTSASGDTVALTGSGRDIWNTADGFRYYYQSAGTGDCEVIVRVASLQDTNGWAKAGVMLRESLDPGSPEAWICVSAEHGTAFQWRASANGDTQSTAPSEDGTAPRWLKLVFTAAGADASEPVPDSVWSYVSADGRTWTAAGALRYNSPAWRYIGLAVTSHNDGTLCTAQFDNLKLLTPPPAPTDFRVAHRGPNGEIDLAWNYSTTDVDQFAIRTNRDTAGDHDWHVAATVPGSARQAVIQIGNTDGAKVEIKAFRDFVRSPAAQLWAKPTITPSLTVTGTTSSSISLRVTESFGYNGGENGPWSIERSSDGVNFVEIASGLTATGGTAYSYATDYTDSGLPTGVTRYYRARELRTNGDSSAYSTVVSATTTASGSVPLAPRNLRMTGNAGNQVQLAWEDDATNETSYELERSTGSGAFSLLATLAADSKQYTDSSVAPSTGYSYRVRAVNGAGASTYSNTLTITSAPPPPAAPSNLAVSSVTATQVSLTWTDNSPERTASFELQRSTDGVNFVRPSWTSSGPPFTNATDATVSPSTTYYYRVQAVNVSGSSAFSNVVQVTTPAGAPRAAPSGLAATALSSSQIQLSWTDNANNESSYEVQRSTDGVNFDVTFGLLAANSTSMTDTALNASTTYYYRVRAINSFGTSAYSNVASATTPATSSPPPSGTWQSGDVGAVAMTGSDSTSGSTVTITGGGADIWGGSDSFRFRYQALSGDGAITARVAGMTDTDGWAKAGVMIRNSLSADARNVLACVTPEWHGIVAQARSADGGATTSATGPAANPPYWLKLTRAGMTFTAQASSDGATWTTYATFNVTMDTNVVVGLAVTSHNQNALCTATFDHVTFTTGSTTGGTVPLAPGNLSANPWSNSQVELVWSDNSTNETGFVIERSTASAGPFAAVTTAAANTRRFVDSGLTSLTTYWYRVHAVNAAGASTDSNVANATVPSSNGPTAAPTLAASATTSTSVALNWTQGSGSYLWYVERSTDGIAFSALFSSASSQTAVTDNTAQPSTTYYYRVRSSDSGGYSPYSNIATATTPASTSNPWSFGDIGIHGVAGSNSASGNSITINGSGADFWDTADGGYFVWKAWTGDGVVEARVTSMGNTNGWAKAGVMIRESANAGARNVFVALTPTWHGIVAQARNNPDDVTTQTAGPTTNAPYWVRLARTGNTFTASTSPDGVTWTPFATYSVAMSTSAYFGFAVTSHDNTQLNQAVFADPFVGTR
jgi:regulation of enolase protein 1 (concanavalin A-like superfamily)